MKILYFLISVAFLFFVNSSYALDISRNDANSIVLEGKVERGDYAKLSNFLRNKYTTGAFLLNKIILNSPGGDVAEALLISNLIKTASGYSMVPEDGICFSACFIMWSGGAIREVQGNAKLGVHRMTLSDDDATVLKAERLLKPLSNTVEGYLRDIGIPRIIIDKMNETSPSDIFIVDGKWLFGNNLDYSAKFTPFFVDVAEKKCGENSYVKLRKGESKVDKVEIQNWMKCVNDFRRKNAMDNILSFMDLIAPKKIN